MNEKRRIDVSKPARRRDVSGFGPVAGSSDSSGNQADGGRYVEVTIDLSPEDQAKEDYRADLQAQVREVERDEVVAVRIIHPDDDGTV